MTYFKTNAHRMRYAYLRSLELFIASGVVEAGCNNVLGDPNTTAHDDLQICRAPCGVALLKIVGALSENSGVGVNNRQRRAMKARKNAKQRGSRNEQTSPRTDSFRASEDFQIGAASLALRHVALRRAHGHSLMADAEAQFTRCADRHQQLAFDDQLGFTVCGLFEHGWTPLDLYSAARRRVDAAVTEHLMCVVAQQTAGHGPVHPDWVAQVSALSTTVDGGSQAWANRTGLPWPVLREQLIELLVLLVSLPILETVLAAPGTAASSMSAASSGVDERVLRKVRALLAKAESTEHEDEADALTAKAQQLMTAHSIERAVAEGVRQSRGHPVVRRIWLDAPYLTAKAMVIGAVARSNDCYSILSKAWGFVTIVGHSADLDTTELLSTSLLVQATRAMTATGSHTTRSGISRTRSFRQSFLVAYASRIGERLAEASTAAQTTADTERGGTLLPVLAARADEVRATAGRLFPEVAHTQVHVGSPSGWGAGRAAADLALFDVREALTERAG